MNEATSSFRCGGDISCRALHFSGQGLIPVLVKCMPQKGMSCERNIHLDPLSVRLCCSNNMKIFSSDLKCSSSVVVATIMSS